MASVEDDRVTGWGVFLMLPRVLLHRPLEGGANSRQKMVAQFEDSSPLMFLKQTCPGGHPNPGNFGHQVLNRVFRSRSNLQMCLKDASVSRRRARQKDPLADFRTLATSLAFRGLHLLFQIPERMATAQVLVNFIWMGRLTALSKFDGGVRGIGATSRDQYVMTTRAGCESVAHALRCKG